MQQIEGHLDHLCAAYERGCWQERHYLDRLSGRVVIVTEETRAALQEVYDRVGEQAALPWLNDASLQAAHQVEMDDERYWKVPTRSRTAWAQLRDSFAAGVEPPLQRLLWQALDYDDPAQFDRLLALDAGDAARWHAFRMADAERALRAWLAAQGVELVVNASAG